MRCFHSIVPTSLMDFYDALGITRDVASRPEKKHYPLRALFSVRYYFDMIKATDADGDGSKEPEPASETLDEMPGFTFLKEDNGFYIYENQAFLPMGIAYEYFVDEAELPNSTPLTREKLMLKALTMTQEQMAQYSDIMTTMPSTARYGMDDTQFQAYCEERAADCCDSFAYDSYGFSAHIALDKPKMVFFSVPYEDGWTAKVNGKEVPVEKVNVGFMAVRCETGDNQIEFHYETPGLRSGAVTSVCGIAALVLYLLWMGIREKDVPLTEPKRKYCYDYVSVGAFSEHETYLSHASTKTYAERKKQKPPRSEEKQEEHPNG